MGARSAWSWGNSPPGHAGAGRAAAPGAAALPGAAGGLAAGVGGRTRGEPAGALPGHPGRPRGTGSCSTLISVVKERRPLGLSATPVSVYGAACSTAVCPREDEVWRPRNPVRPADTLLPSWRWGHRRPVGVLRIRTCLTLPPLLHRRWEKAGNALSVRGLRPNVGDI